jgi:RHS repeat-associated protein
MRLFPGSRLLSALVICLAAAALPAGVHAQTAPVVTQPSNDRNDAVGTTLPQIQIEVQDAEGGPFTYKLLGRPTGVQSPTAAGVITGTTSSAATPYAKAVLDSAPTRYWRLDETSGPTAVAQGGIGNLTIGSQVTFASHTLFGGSSNNHFTFAGLATQLLNGGFTGLGRSFSLEFWYRPDDSGSVDLQGIVAASGGAGLLFQRPSRTLAWRGQQVSGGAVINQSNTTALTVGQWYHVALVFQAPTGPGTATFYINGVADGTFPVYINPANSWTPQEIGGNTSGGGRLRGGLDEMAHFNRALSRAEVAAHYAARVPNTVTVIATDSTSLSGSRTFLWTVTTDQAPVISGPTSASHASTAWADVLINATDAETISYSAVSGLPPGITVDPVTGRMTGWLGAAGSYSATVKATANGLSTNHTFPWTVTPNQSPQILSPSSGTVTHAVYTPSATVTITATDPEQRELVYGVTGAVPPGISLQGSQLTGTPTVGGSYLLTVTATDPGGLVSSASFTWTITDLPPAFSSPPGDRDDEAGATIQPITISAADPEGRAVTYQAYGLPNGLTFNETSGVISGTLVAPGPAYAPMVLAAGPAAYWRLEESGGMAIAADSGPSGRGLTILGGVSAGVPGTLGDQTKAFSFDGSSGYLTRAHEAWMNDLASAFTVEFSFATTASGFMRVIGKGNTAASEMFGVWLWSGGSDPFAERWFLQVRRGGQPYGLASWDRGLTFADGRPHRGVVTWNAATSQLTFSIDGSLIRELTVPGSGPLETNADPLEVGRLAGAPNYWNGTLDEIAVYTRAFPASEVTQHYRSLSSSTVTIAAFDGAQRATHSFDWTVTAPPPPMLSIEGPGMLSHPQGTTVDIPVTVSGGSSNLTVQVTGSLPQGVSYNPATRRLVGRVDSPPGAPYRDTILAANPVRYYRFEEATGAATTTSLVNNDYLTIVQPVTSIASTLLNDGSKAFKFQGASPQKLSRVQTVTNGTAFSLELWFKPEAGGAARQALISDMSSLGLYFSSTNRTLLWYGKPAGQQTNVDQPSTATLSNGQWYHVVAVISGTQGTFYVNGVAGGTFSRTSGGYIFQTVAVATSGAGWLKGELDEFAAYSTALSPETIAAHYAARIARTFTVTATDGQQTVSQTYTWTVTPNTPPTLGPLSNRANNIGDVLSPIVLQGADADGHPLTYTATPLPSGVQVSGNTIIGTVGGSANSYTVIVTARDAFAASPSQSFTWQINDPTPPCTYGVSQSSFTVDAAGGAFLVFVTTPPQCLWQATTPAGWLTLPYGAAGTGDSWVAVEVAANDTGSPRSTQLTISSTVTVTFTQAPAEQGPPGDPPPSDGPGDGVDPGGEVSYYFLDAIGSVRAINDASGTTTYDYTPFGVASSTSGSTNSKLRFTGKERDFELSTSSQQPLDYFGVRYYQAQLARFTSVDPGHAGTNLLDPQSWNGYAYALNNPLRFIDPLGTCSQDAQGNYVDSDDGGTLITSGPCPRGKDGALTFGAAETVSVRSKSQMLILAEGISRGAGPVASPTFIAGFYGASVLTAGAAVPGAAAGMFGLAGSAVTATLPTVRALTVATTVTVGVRVAQLPPGVSVWDVAGEVGSTVAPMFMDCGYSGCQMAPGPMLSWYGIGANSGAAVLEAWSNYKKRR